MTSRLQTWLLAGMLALCTFAAQAQEILITEFVAINDGSWVDGEGDEPDWIELHNTRSSTVDLTGWHLTDDADDLRKWTFPSASIGPDEYLVVFASNKNKADPAGWLHTNFKLSSGGEYLALVRPDLTVEHAYAPGYPPQYPDVSYGVSVIGSTVDTLIAPGAQATYLVPTSNVDDVSIAATPWNEPAFDDTPWTATDLGVGYAREAPGDAYYTYIGSNGDVETLMDGVRASVYIRVPFVVDDPARVTSLTLWVRYDDGFAAYVNGGSTTVAGANHPADGELAYSATATSGHPDSLATDLVPFAISLSEISLMAGSNVLAVHGLNRGVTNSDFLFDCVLEATTAPTSSVSAAVYMTAVTPGQSNAGGVESLGPIFREVTDRAEMLDPLTDTGIVVTARVEAAGSPVAGVTLYHRQMFGPESAVAMNDDGQLPDAVGGDGIYAATVPLAGLAAGHMIRWRMEAEDDAGTVSRAPLFHDPLNAPEYYGTIAAYAAHDPSVTSTLPVIHWFVEDPSAADTDAGTRASAWFRGEFYDNFLARRRGGSTSGLPKKSYKFDFNSRAHFRFDPEAGRAEEINLNQTWSEKSYIRQSLTFEMYDWCGSPGSESHVVRLQRNGQFHALNAFVEQPDKRLLKREGLNDRGALYKMFNTFTSGTSGVQKKNREFEDHADLSAFVAAIRNTSDAQLDRNIFDQVDIPRQLNYLVATVLSQNNDSMAKNYYLYRDSDGSGEWFQIAWDTDLTWGRHWMNGGNSGDGMWADLDYREYDSSGNYLSPSHPFVGTEELQGNRSWNRLIDKLYENPRFAAMFRRRLRTVMDEWFAPPVLENRIAELQAQLSPDAAEDTAKWGQYGTSQTLAEALGVLKIGYIEPKRTHLFDTHNVNHAAGYPTYPDASVVSAELPDPQPDDAVVSFSTIDYSPASGNQDEEYICITNANDYAVDVSGWRIRGGVSHTLLPGTVILPDETLYLTPSASTFRARTLAPKGGMGLFVQGGYEGRLNARGETLTLTDTAGRLVSSASYAGTPSDAQQYLRVTEIMYNPSPMPAITNDAQAFEYIELRNVSTHVPLDLSGVRFSQGVLFDFTGSAITNLGPGAYALVVRDEAAFTTRYGSGLPVAGMFTGLLDSNGETLRLDDAAGEKILEFSYDNRWYPATDGHGFSLVIVDDLALWSTWGDPAGWRPSGVFDGSPGAADATPDIAPILVNEVLAHTDLPDVDAIELFNPTSTSGDLGGWFLSDDALNPKKYRIAPGTTIAGGGFALFTEADFNAGGTNAFLLSELGDTVCLFSGDATTNLSGYAHARDFKVSPNGISFGRHVDSQGTDHFVLQHSNTLGSANGPPLVGPVVVSEIMYHPPDPSYGVDNDLDEFIELANITGTDVPLYSTDTNEPGYGSAALSNTWRLRNAVDYDFPTNVTLLAGERLVVVGFDPADTEQLAAFRSLYAVPTHVPVYGPWSGKLDNTGEEIELKRPGVPETAGPVFVPYLIVEEIDYSEAAPWPTAADGLGPLLQRRLHGNFGNDPLNWRAAYPRGVTAPDTDGDGMTDWWEEDNGLVVGIDDSGLDPDEDGMTNAREETAGTDPHDASSVLRVVSISAGPGVSLSFKAMADLGYTTQYAETPVSTNWQVMEHIAPATTNRTVHLLLPSPNPEQGYYRVTTGGTD